MSTSFTIYMVGILIVAAALAYGAYALSVPPIWIGVGTALIIGLGLMGAAKKTRNASDRT